MRVFFARLLVHCAPADPAELWENFKDALSEDYMQHYNYETAIIMAYREVAKIMAEEGKPLNNFKDMPALPEDNLENEEVIDRAKTLEEALMNYSLLNEDQQNIIDNILAKLSLPLPEASKSNLRTITNCVFIDGPGGTGKTTIYNVLNSFLKAYGLKSYNAAYTGIAAVLLPSGRTIHNLFGLPVPLYNDSNSKIGPASNAWKNLLETDVILLDEASMIPRHALRIMDDLMRQITGSDMPFGGKQFIFGGDFRQTLPIQRHATRAQQVDLCMKRSNLWKNVSLFKLTKNMRALEEEREFARWILQIGNGEINDKDNWVSLPNECICEDGLEEEIFSAPIARADWKEVGKRAILAPLNINVDEINEKVLKMIPGEEYVYKSINEAKKADNSNVDANLFPIEFLQSLKPQGFAPHELKLKKHCTVMLIRNLNIKRGLVNGTRFEVIGIHKNLVECKIIGGQNAGQIELIPRITLDCKDEYPFILSRHQFPLRLCFACTINKSQGQTLEKVGIDLRTEVFGHGQLYVALSRARSFVSVRILVPKENNRRVKNIVYTEILED